MSQMLQADTGFDGAGSVAAVRRHSGEVRAPVPVELVSNNGHGRLARVLMTPLIVAGRSFFALLALGLIASMKLWGPWVSLGLGIIAWKAVMRWM